MKFKKLISINLFVLCFFASPSQAVVLKIASISPDGTEWMTKLRLAAEDIKNKTQGRVKFKFYPGGVMGNEQSVLRKIRFGQLHGGVFTAGNLNSVYPDIQIYSLPFLFESSEQITYVRKQMDQKLLDGLLQKGFVSFGMVGAGFAYPMANIPLQSMDDFVKHKVWIPAGDKLSLITMKSAGVAPIPLPLADVLTGLQTGMIDIAAVSAMGAIAFQWYTVLDHLIEQPISYIYGLLAIDNKTFKKIAAADRKIVADVLTKFNQDMDQKSWQDNDGAKSALKTQGVKFATFSDALLREWQGYAKQAISRMGEEGEYTPAMLQTLLQYIQQYEAEQK